MAKHTNSAVCFGLLVCLGLVTGCGQTGALYLPSGGVSKTNQVADQPVQNQSSDAHKQGEQEVNLQKIQADPNDY